MNYKQAIANTNKTYSQIKKVVDDLAALHPAMKPKDCEKQILHIAARNTLSFQMLETFTEAFKLANQEYPGTPDEWRRGFAAAVADLCHNPPTLPTNARTAAIAEVMHIFGGPTVRELAVSWAAYGRGDALKDSHEGMTAWHLDPRFKTPGTWDFKFACDFAREFCFGPISDFHREVWRSEKNTFGNVPDMKDLKK